MMICQLWMQFTLGTFHFGELSFIVVLLYSHMQYHNDTIIMTQEDFFIKIYTSHFIVRFERVVWGSTVRGNWRPNRTAIYWPRLLWPSALCLSRSPGLLNRRPRGPLCWVMAFFTASYQQLLWTPTHRGPRGPLRPGVAFPTTTYQQPYSNCNSNCWLLSWLNYIIVQRPLNRLLDLWNGMFDRHQAEITVMQFTGHSLPVHQSMSVP